MRILKFHYCYFLHGDLADCFCDKNLDPFSFPLYNVLEKQELIFLFGNVLKLEKEKKNSSVYEFVGKR